MMMSPIAIGIFVVSGLKAIHEAGRGWDEMTNGCADRHCEEDPEGVRKRSRNDSFLRAAGAQTRPCVTEVVGISKPRRLLPGRRWGQEHHRAERT